MRNVFNYFKQKLITDPVEVDKLIVSAFLHINKLSVQNNILIKSLTINEEDINLFEVLDGVINVIKVESQTFDFENLIELFEFVISPAEKVVTGAVYTPLYIRNYIVRQLLIQYEGDLINIKVADIACGCGGFLLSVTSELKRQLNCTFKTIYERLIFGIDIAAYSVNRSKILLSLYALINGEDESFYDFNLVVGNSLSYRWDGYKAIRLNGGFDIIAGNPPYVCSRNMDNETKELLKNWKVSITGHPDLYIPFFQVGIENLKADGILGFITVNTFLKSVNGRALRLYFAENESQLSILNFGGEQIFKDRNTYTCICFIKRSRGLIHYLKTESANLESITIDKLQEFRYEQLDHFDGWNLVNDLQTSEFINIVENQGVPFKTVFNTKNGIATLKNEVYKFKSIDINNDNDRFYYLNDDGIIFPIEREICRDIVNANKIKSEADVDTIRELIIFPYDEQINIIPEQTMQHRFPFAYNYLSSKRAILGGRDKGKALENYEAWYAYGRKQSMDIHAYKLFFPHICESPRFVICTDLDLLFYNGIAIVSDDLGELRLIKKILESKIFNRYIKNTAKDYSSGFISLSKNYLKNFGVIEFTDEQKEFILANDDIDEFLDEIYGVVGM